MLMSPSPGGVEFTQVITVIEKQVASIKHSKKGKFLSCIKGFNHLNEWMKNASISYLLCAKHSAMCWGYKWKIRQSLLSTSSHSNEGDLPYGRFQQQVIRKDLMVLGVLQQKRWQCLSLYVISTNKIMSISDVKPLNSVKTFLFYALCNSGYSTCKNSCQVASAQGLHHGWWLRALGWKHWHS